MRAPSRSRWEEWLAHWLATRARATSTVRGYLGHVRLYLAPYLGTILLAELSTSQVQAMFTVIAREHEVEGRPVTLATLNRIRATLRAALNAAIRQGLISDNPRPGPSFQRRGGPAVSHGPQPGSSTGSALGKGRP